MIGMRRIFLLAVAFTLLSGACSGGPVVADPQEPVLPQITVSELCTENGKTFVLVDGKPFPFIGAQIRLDALMNCEQKPVSAIEPYFRKAVELGLNCVQVPVCWKMIEPQEGSYDWTVVDALLGYCNKYDLKMELLWFSTNMIGDSFSYFVPQYILSNPSVRLWRNDNGSFWNYYGYQYALVLDDSWILEHETRAVTAMFNHIRYWDSLNGEHHPVISCQVHNEPDGFVRWRYFQKEYRNWDGSELSQQRAWEMVCNALDAVGKAVQNSSYKVLTRTNLVKGNGIEPFPEAAMASPEAVFDLEGIDFVSVDIYRNSVADVRSEVGDYASIPGNYALVGENKGSYSHSPSLILAAFASGGGYDIYDLATSRFFLDNTNDRDEVDHGVYTYDLQEKPGITEPTRLIVSGLAMAAGDVAVTPPADFAAFNIGQDAPQPSLSETIGTSASTIGFETSSGAIGFALDRGEYVVLYATEDAVFTVSRPGQPTVTVNVGGGELYRYDM